MSIQSEITLLNNTKEAIKDAIKSKGVMVASTDPFAIYPTRIGQISSTPGDKENLFKALVERTYTTLEVPYGTEVIRNFCFYDNDVVTSITLPETLKSIKKEAFYSCGNLTSITIPANVTYIGEKAFQYCTSLTSITCLGTVPATLAGTSIYVFDNTNNCPIYVPEDSVDAYKAAWTKYADRIQEMASTRKGRVHYKDGTTADIPLNGNSTLYANELESLIVDGNPIVGLEVSNQCTQIAKNSGGSNYGFVHCAPELSWVMASNTVKTLGVEVFDSCQYITSLDDIQLPGVTGYPIWTFGHCRGLTDVNIPEGIQVVMSECFYNCQNISSLHIPSTVSGFNDYIHKQDGIGATYTPLTSITVDPNNTTYTSVGNCLIRLYNGGYRLVLGCSTSVIPTDLSNLLIEANAFANNVQGNSRDYTVPANVATIGYNAFGNANSVTMLSSTPCTLYSNAFGNAFPIYVPSGSLETYLADSSWAVYEDRLFERGVAKWTEQSYQCEVDETDTKTGMVTVVEQDTNPTSSTYGQTRQRIYEDLEKCNPSGNTFSKITQLADATTGKYIVVYDNGDGTGLALKASLIKNTSSTSNGINANNNFIDVSISDGDVFLSEEDTSTTAFDYDGNYISWTDPDTETAYRLCGRSSGAAFEYSIPNHNVQPASTTYGFSFKDNLNNRLIALFTNSTSGAQKFRWDSSSSATLNGVGIYKLN